MQKQQESGQKIDTGFEKAGAVKVDGTTGTITVTLPDTVLFDSGKADLKRSSSAELDQIISTLKSRSEYAGKPIDIVGHTDSDPISKSNWKDNWQLSGERAQTVLRYMSSRGIASERLRFVGCGDSKPVVPNSSASNKARNRRVEVVIHMFK
jgi:chemotaxis protein MotB